MRTDLVISEIYGPVIQGEGPLVGMPTIFVRTGGCDFACVWCDSMHAVDKERYGDSWEHLSTNDVLDTILTRSRGFPMLVSLSGGNPALMPFAKLIEEGQAMGYTFALETQGSITRDWFASLDYLVLSPKPPSAEVPAFNLNRLEQCVVMAEKGRKVQIAIKVVVFDNADYQFALAFRDWVKDRPHIRVYLQPGTPASVPKHCVTTNLATAHL
ncbi:MAG: 7-carboxy-7-deazaguanine synthase QueE, partial [Pyrinomonadaceae bacterium]